MDRGRRRLGRSLSRSRIDGGRQPQGEDRAGARAVAQMDVAAMGAQHLARDGETEPRPARPRRAGERPEETLIRELNEELGIIVNEACLAPLTFASHAYADFHLLMPLYVCRRWEGIVTGREGQQLAWVRPNRLREYPMPAADVPLIPHLTALL